MRRRALRRSGAALGALVAVLVAVNFAAWRSRVAWDLTAERSATLSAETRRVLGEVRRRVEITAFFGREDPGRVEAAVLLSRYRDENRLVSFDIKDPDAAPGEAARLGVARRGSAALEMGDEIEIAPDVIEIDVTSALARLVRGRTGTVCFATGHGEPGVEDRGPAGLSSAADLLRENGYTVTAVDLLAQPVVDRSCDAVVVAAPRSELGEAAIGGVRKYLSEAGKALLLGDYESAGDLGAVAAPWKLGFTRGVVLEGDPDSRLPGDPGAPIIRRYSRSSPPVHGLPPTIMPVAMGVEVGESDHPGLTLAPAAETSGDAYLERNPGDGRFHADTDVAGPIVVAASADDSRVLDAAGPRPRVHRTRIFAVGDVDFATNAFVREGGNGRLVVQALDWLTQPEPLLAAVPSFPRLRELELTEARSDYILFLTSAVVPGLFLLVGALVWAVRRGR